MDRTYLVTGGAGFIGSSLIDRLISDKNSKIICVDNFDDFYPENIKRNNIKKHITKPNYKLYQVDITDFISLKHIFKLNNITHVIHLAANAGVRPSLLQPIKYTNTNINGTVNLLELARDYNVKKFVFGSSSSVYGVKTDGPFKEDDNIGKPISPYAATKAAGEQICYTYSHLHNINITCLRFFTVYGPKQRPDLAIHKFSKLICNGKPLEMYGNGLTKRDYTYIDDIINGILAAIEYNKSPYEIFNLGESDTVELNYLISLIEDSLKKKAVIEHKQIQPGDVPITYADVSKAKTLLNYNPSTNIEEGIKRFIYWFKDYYEIKKA